MNNFGDTELDIAGLRRQIEYVRDEFHGINVTITSPLREVSVSVNGAGQVRDVQIFGAGMRLGEDALGQKLVQTIAEAQQEAARRAAELSAQLRARDPQGAQAYSAAQELFGAQ